MLVPREGQEGAVAETRLPRTEPRGAGGTGSLPGGLLRTFGTRRTSPLAR